MSFILEYPFYYIYFDNGADFTQKKRIFCPVNIQLLNQYSEILELNYMDFSFSLEPELGYDI
jgi:hypothetical protein